MRDMPEREKRGDNRALVATALVTVGLFLGGYGLACVVTGEARSAFEWRFWHQVERNGHPYCDLTEFEGGKLIAQQR